MEDNDEFYFQKLHPNLEITLQQTIMVLLTFITRHNLSKIAGTDLLNLINLIIGMNSLPKSYKKFLSMFKSTLNSERKYYCANCKVLTECLERVCQYCSSKDKKYFITCSIKNQIESIISQNMKEIHDYKKNLKEGNIGDVTQGMYLKSKTNFDFSISFNTDGFSPFKSSTLKSMWPIIITINDLPPHLRFSKKNMILAGLWMDTCPPVMEIFLKSFTTEVNEIAEIGIFIANKNFKIVCTKCCVDSMARLKLLNHTQFNGYYGCTFCLHPGNVVRISSTTKQIRYIFDSNIQQRVTSEHLKHMQSACTENKKIFGVKGISPLVMIKEFDFIQCCPPDYMHNVLLGVVKMLSDLWFDSKNNN